MHTVLLVMMAVPLLQQPATDAPKGDPQNGEAVYRQKLCRLCHGDNGEGGFGPDLAGGRGLTFSQFEHTIRKPWGVMLSYTEGQLPDQAVADIYAFLRTKPTVAEPGHWHWPAAAASAPYEQRVYMQVTGCSQCHEPENKFARALLGRNAKDVNFEYFKTQIYNHTDRYPNGRMGNYSTDRLSETNLREIYGFMVEELGLRASITGAIGVKDQQDGKTNYTVTVTNLGMQDRGLTANRMTVFVRVPAGAEFDSASGPGYSGVQPLAALRLHPAIQFATHPNELGLIVRPKPDLSGDVMVWKIPKLVAADKLELSFTLAGAPTLELLRAFEGSTVYWEKPGRNAYGQKLAYRDTRTPDEGDHERIPPPIMPAPTAPSASSR